MRVLSTHGVAPDRLAVIGYGEQRPIKPNDTPEGRNANRRVIIVILSTDLMRQAPAEAQSTDAAGTAPAVTAPAAASPAPAITGAAPSTAASPPEVANPDAAIFHAAPTNDAVSAPAEPATAQPAAAPPPLTQTQHNTGTEPAP